MSNLTGLLLTGALVACSATASGANKLRVHIGMAASDFNSQVFVTSRKRPLPVQGASWVAYNGEMDLVITFGSHEITFPVSAQNGVVQISAWRGLSSEFEDPRVNSINFVLDQQMITYEDALSISSKYCTMAIDAGLEISAISEEANRKIDRITVMNNMNGAEVCAARSDREILSLQVVPHDFGNSNTLFRIEGTIVNFFETVI